MGHNQALCPILMAKALGWKAPAPPVPPGAPRRAGRVPAPRVIVDRCVTCNLAPPKATFSRSLTGYRRKTCDTCRAENEAAAAREDEAWKAAGVLADLPALREAYAREQAAKKLRPRPSVGAT